MKFEGIYPRVGGVEHVKAQRLPRLGYRYSEVIVGEVFEPFPFRVLFYLRAEGEGGASL